MKKILALILAAVMCICMVNIVLAAEFKFTDVPEGQWYYEHVKSAVEMGLINGKSETTYCPDDNLTYAEAIKLAACMNQLYNDGVITLKNGNPWYQSYVDYCVNKGIIDKEYNYTENATRAGYMGIFAKALPDEGLKAINNVPDDSIPDVPSARAYAEGVYKLYRAGILQGVDDAHNCSPLANIKRSEVATILVRMMDATKRVEFSMGAEEEKPEEAKPLAIKTQPVAVSVNSGETATLTVEVEGGKAPYTYQWRNTVTIIKTVTTNFEDSETVSGATTNVLSLISDVKKTYNINCEITDAEGTKIYTDTVTVSFNGSGIKDKFDDDDTALEKSDFKLVVDGIYVVTGQGLVVTGRVESGMLEVGDVVGFYDESGIYYLADASVTGIEMFNKLLPDCEKGDNVGLRITLDPEEWKDKLVEGMVIKFEREPYALAIKTQPANAEVTANKAVAITVEATGGTGEYLYQWQINNSSAWSTLTDGWHGASGIKTQTLSLTPTEAGTLTVRCIVSDTDGNVIISDGAVITVNAATSTGGKDKFEQVDKEELKNEDFAMTINGVVNVADRGIVLKGYVTAGKLNVGDTVYLNDADGKYVATTTVKAIEMFSKLLDECKARDTAGINVDLDVETYKAMDLNGYVLSATKGSSSLGTRPSSSRPTGVSRPLDSIISKELDITSVSNDMSGAAGIFYLNVEAEGGKAPYTYQWQRLVTITVGRRKTTKPVNLVDDENTVRGATTANLIVSISALDTYYYRCVVTDADGNEVTSEIITVTVDSESSGGRGSIPTSGKLGA